MAQKEKQGRGFFDKILRKDPPSEESKPTFSQATGSNSSTSTEYYPNVANAPAIELTGDAKTFVAKFREGIQKTNEIGQSFIQILYNLDKEPKDSQYKQAFELIRIMNPTITADEIKSSLERLIAFVKSQTAIYNDQGNNKMTQLKSSLKDEKSSLETTIASIQTEINTMRNKLGAKEQELSKQQTALNAVDGKYQPQINDAENTLAAINAASQETCSSLNQFLVGVEKYLKTN